MALPLIRSQAKKRDQIVVLDLGSRTTKAVYLRRRSDQFQLLNFAFVDAPVYEKNLSADLLSEHLKSVMQSLGARTRQSVLVIGPSDSLLRHAELPMMPVSDMRMMLKLNPKNYLQQDFRDHVFDCYILPSSLQGGDGSRGTQKCKVLVGGARQQSVHDLQAAAKAAGLMLDQISLALAAPPNALEYAFPDVFQNEVVALVDVGFKNTTINILSSGELALNRVVGVGGDKLTSGLAENMGISYAEAEGIKIGMAEEVQAVLQALITPLGRELRASIDFFEHQHDKPVSRVYVSGGTARSEFIVESLQAELMVPCQNWNPTCFLELQLPPQQMGEVESVAPQLVVAIGAAMAAF